MVSIWSVRWVGLNASLAEIFPTRGYYRGAYYQFGRNTLSYSPDGKYLAVADTTAAGEPFRIFLLEVETGDKRPLTFPPAASVGTTLQRLLSRRDDPGIRPPHGGRERHLRCARDGRET